MNEIVNEALSEMLDELGLTLYVVANDVWDEYVVDVAPLTAPEYTI